jgi:hypothetical protein
MVIYSCKSWRHIAAFLDKFHVMYSDFRSGNLTYCLEGMDRLAWLTFLNSVARYVILSFISVYHVEGKVIGCIMLKDITKIITTHWFSTELSIVVTVCNSAIVASVAHEIFQLRLFLPPSTLLNVK